MRKLGWSIGLGVLVVSPPPPSVYPQGSFRYGTVNGARGALIPLENKPDFPEASGDIIERVDPIFFSDPMTAAMKVQGLT